MQSHLCKTQKYPNPGTLNGKLEAKFSTTARGRDGMCYVWSESD